MTSVFLQSPQGSEHAVTELPLEPVWYGVLALVGFIALLGLLWSFRNTLALDPVEHQDGHGHGQGRNQGAGTAADGHH